MPNKVFIIICLLFAAHAGLACDYPSNRATIPNGSTTTKEELLEAQKGVKSYMAALTAYRDCIVEEEKLARLAMENLAPEIEQQREEMLNKKYNAAVEDEERVAADFNTAVQAFKQRDQ